MYHLKGENTKMKSKFKSKNFKHEFTSSKLTPYSGLSPIMKYLNKEGLGKELNKLFPTQMYNSNKFSNVQVLLSVVLASLAGVNRLKRIANFTRDYLVMNLLGLEKGLNKDVISVRLKQMGQTGSIKLQEFLLNWQKRWIDKVVNDYITLDADSTVQTVYGNQEGAAKGYNPHKKGAKSYHPLLVFAGELKIVLNSWFRTGSAYTSNGICEFMKQTKHHLPSKIKHVFFRADSGFFNGELFDLLEGFGWTYLVKVKLKNLMVLLKEQEWETVEGNPNMSYCEFEYKGKGWTKTRKIKAVRTVKEWVESDFFGKTEQVAKYEYACYCSNLENDALELHESYKRRSVSETWIEEVKGQLLAGKNLTDNFHANDILWQLQVLAYNISVMIRYKVKKYWRQEHKTLRDWFINIPANLVYSGHQFKLKIYEHYYYKNRWMELVQLLSN
jgi:hypothetical protein